MAFRFVVPDSSPPSSPAPSTPDRNEKGSGFSFLADNPSTTPAGPPPSSVGSFTPAGAPTASFLGSSMMHGMSDSRPSTFGSTPARSAGKTLFGRTNNATAPLGRSIRGRDRQPSTLSRQFSAADEEDEEDEDAEGEPELPPPGGSLFRMTAPSARGFNNEAEIDAQIENLINEDMDAEGEEIDEYEDADNYMRHEAGSDDGDMFLSMRHDDRPYGQPIIGDESDLMMLNTPAATDRVRKEAEDFFKRSSVHFGTTARKAGFQFATVAKDLYTRQEPARIAEPADLILQTEQLVSRLYDEGVGAEDNAEMLDNSLANVTYRLVQLWNDYVEQLPQPEGEESASIGPGADAEPFEKAAYVAHLILRMHHTRFDRNTDNEKTPPLPEILFDWMQTSHNLYPDQVREISRYKPSPACHSVFWQTVRCALLRGDVSGASQLLQNAGWENIRRGPRGEFAYIGKALDNVRKFVAATCEVLDQCPGNDSDWDIWNSKWTLFRIQARGSLDRLTLFAEGNDQSLRDSMDDEFNPQGDSMSNMARKASSQLPWDIYENLQTIYGIILGNQEAIMEVAQDWCEATVGLMGWWDNGNQRQSNFRLSHSQSFRAANLSNTEDYFVRLAAAFHQVIESDMNPNVINPVEVAIASAFEGNVNAVLGFLRGWSLPVACTVAEVASLGGWLPETESANPLPMDNLDMDDLALLGVSQPSQDELQGIKDTSLVLYARELAGIEQLSAERDGWEMAIQVLGRMDSPEKSEETVGELLRDLLAILDEHSNQTVDKTWRILNDLGMINYAEETAETFAEILSKQTHRYGEALWYYALAHRPDKVREVLNLLMSYSLIHSTVYPAESDLDNDLKDLLRRRNETLATRAKQDLEAAQLLGRMLSGYATLRKFYEIRDDPQLQAMSATKATALKRQAAVALVAVIASSDDNIRGGLYDDTRDSVVSEDFLLALLGEATVLVNESPAIVSLIQIDVLLKAIEDIETVGDRVYSACDEFFQLVLASGQDLKGSTPADLMTSSLSGSFMLTGSSMLVSHLNKSVAAGGKARRGWDWRKGFRASSKGQDVLGKLRMGLSKDLATLWLEDTDGVAVY